MSLDLEDIQVPGYEKVIKVTDKKSGLQAIISIHNTVLGPGLGGIRIKPYNNFQEALTDVLRLSKGMTYKSAIAEVGTGGAKSVIIANEGKSEEMLQAFGNAIEKLQGTYIGAEDVGCTVNDVGVMRKATKFLVGLEHEKSSGNPSPFTAWGIYRGIQSVLQKLDGNPSVAGKRIAIQGLGSVGELLLSYLFWNGAEVIATDPDKEKLQRLAAQYGIETCGLDEIYQVPCDVFSPCALGGILNSQTIPQLKCRAVAGAANNQLLEEQHGDELHERNILYAPDFVINAGGLINVLCELEPSGYKASKARHKTHQIYDQLLTIYDVAEKNNFSTAKAAVSLADYRIKYGVGKRKEGFCFHH